MWLLIKRHRRAIDSIGCRSEQGSSLHSTYFDDFFLISMCNKQSFQIGKEHAEVYLLYNNNNNNNNNNNTHCAQMHIN